MLSKAKSQEDIQRIKLNIESVLDDMDELQKWQGHFAAEGNRK